MVGSPGGRFCTIPRASQAPLVVLHGGCTSPTGARQPPTPLADGAVAMAAGSVLGGIGLAERPSGVCWGNCGSKGRSSAWAQRRALGPVAEVVNVLMSALNILTRWPNEHIRPIPEK